MEFSVRERIRKCHSDTFWHNQYIMYDFRAQLEGLK